MKQTIRWVLVAVVACVVCSLVTYRIAYHRGYWSGEVSQIHLESGVASLVTLGSLQKIRAGDISGATHLLESFCFSKAENFYPDPDHSYGNGVAETLTRELLKYRAAYRTNSMDWDVFEQNLEVELASVK